MPPVTVPMWKVLMLRRLKSRTGDELCRIVSAGGRGDDEAFDLADDAQAAFAHGLQMRAAREKLNFVPRLRQPSAEIATHATGANHSDFH